MKARLPLLLSMAALLVIAVVASRGESAVHPGPRTILPVDDNSTTQPAPSGDSKPNVVVSTIAAIGFTGVLLVFAALFVIGLTVIVMGVSWSRARRAKLSNPISFAESDETTGDLTGGVLLRSAVEKAREDLAVRRPGPPSDAVVAAWLRLEQAAAESGAPRAPHETPTEFTSALLAEHVRDRAAVERLCGLYQRARFGRPSSITEADAEQARAALGAILDDWRVPA